MSYWLPASGLRIAAACCVLLLYATFCLAAVRSHRRRSVDAGAPPASLPATTLVAYASQTGFAQQLAVQTATSMRSAGQSVGLGSIRDVGVDQLAAARRILFVVSTTGEGDAPDPAANFVRSVLGASAELEQLSYAILALGDREYGNFCGFGHRLDAWLRHQGATPLFDVVEVDNGDAGALRHWQHQLGVLAGTPDLPDWDIPRYDRWRLAERRLLNPGSAGHPCFHLSLRAVEASPSWTAGDIAEVDPANSTWTAAAGHTLPHREYSIASIISDGAIELLVRQMRRPDDEPGLGSGWLTITAPLGSEIAVRIRSNPNFHPPTDSRPLLLIGNGTGLAGLRAVLKARIAMGEHRNWLLFGERNQATDYFYRDDIERWQRQGYIERLDVVFSRDPSRQIEGGVEGRAYVQHRLLERADEVREWFAAGASVYVCGSLEGMAPAVDTALRHIVGAESLAQLLAAGRYRRDVY